MVSPVTLYHQLPLIHLFFEKWRPMESYGYLQPCRAFSAGLLRWFFRPFPAVDLQRISEVHVSFTSRGPLLGRRMDEWYVPVTSRMGFSEVSH